MAGAEEAFLGEGEKIAWPGFVVTEAEARDFHFLIIQSSPRRGDSK